MFIIQLIERRIKEHISEINRFNEKDPIVFKQGGDTKTDIIDFCNMANNVSPKDNVCWSVFLTN